MIAALVLAASFAADFPQASTTGSPGQLTHASGFEATGLGETPQAAAAAFFDRYGESFGVSPQQKLVSRGSGSVMRFERQIDGLPIFGGDLVVGIGKANSVVLVNAAAVPTESAGTFRLSRKAAVAKAVKALKGTPSADEPRAIKGWKPSGKTNRPAWRIDLATEAGDWRVFVDAETGAVILRTSLRAALR